MKPSTSLFFWIALLVLPLRANESPDNDGDGLTDAEELVLGTDPAQIDSDNDTLTDGQELEWSSDPLSSDTDGDDLDDAVETGWTGTGDIDTDGDGLTDGSEVNELGSDPLFADSDEDGLADEGEISSGTGILLDDSDADGLLDGTESNIGMDPLAQDSNDDGENDSQAIVRSSHPEVQLQPVGSPHKLQFTAQPYVSYDVLYSTDLDDWEILTQIPATSQPIVKTVAEPVAGSPKGFFNLKPH